MLARPAVHGVDPARRSAALEMAVYTFCILALELALIRWMSGQIRLFAYFANLVLLAAFLGIGLGVAVGRKRPQLIRACLPCLTVLAAILTFSRELGLMHLPFPDPTMSLWGAEASATGWQFVLATTAIVALFWLVAGVFVFAGVPVGWLFESMDPARAYSADLVGSLFGVIAIAGVTALGAPPPVWMALSVVPIAWLTRHPVDGLCAVAVVVLSAVAIDGAHFSPYNRIDLRAEPPIPGVRQEWVLNVNRDFHQTMLDLSQRAVDADSASSDRRRLQSVYDLPFRSAECKRALIVGAGAGNDVAAALRHGCTEVVSVEIDPQILELGKALHPEQPYSDPRVLSVTNDARAYFQQNLDARFDVICYGLLDSHAMFSAMSSLRLDNFVYTVEGVRAGWQQVDEDGVLSISFSIFAGPWMAQRLVNLVTEATGLTPVMIHHRMHYGATFLVGRRLEPQRLDTPFEIVSVAASPDVRIPVDDWPFLYLRPRTIPFAYLAVLGAIVVTAVFAIRAIYGRELFTSQRFDAVMFLLGASFLLIETRMVTQLSLLFGSTWVVNAVVFAGVLVMALLANTIVILRKNEHLLAWYGPLLLGALAIWWIDGSALNELDLLPRGLLGGALFAFPLCFAGIIFSTLLRRSRYPACAFGSNILGAVVGGILEYASLLVGLSALSLIAFFLYLVSLLLVVRRMRCAAWVGKMAAQ